MQGGGRPGLWAIEAVLVINQGPGGVNQAQPMGGYVTLDLLALSAERLRVRAQCLPCFDYDGLGEKFLADLVERICRDYPEAAAGGSPAADVTGTGAAELPTMAAADGGGDPLAVLKDERAREIVRLRNEGYTWQEIGDAPKIMLSWGRVKNILTDIRREHPDLVKDFRRVKS